MEKMNYNLKTEILSGGRIAQEIEAEFDGVMHTINRQVMLTQEHQVKTALIALGWTPPGGCSKGKEKIDEMVDRFLSWPLPASVCADPNASMQGYAYRYGTNLLSATEARQMLEHLFSNE